MIDFSDIISHVKTKPENEFQAVIAFKNPDYNPHNELRTFFYDQIYSPLRYDRNRIFNFMDYHARKFKGTRQQFIDFIMKETQPDRVKRLGGDHWHISNITPANEILRDWFDCKELRQYPDKYLAMYHHIMIALGRAEKYSGNRKDIEEISLRLYNAKSGFYQAFIDYQMMTDNKEKFVNNLSGKARKDWKTIIRAISNNDPDVDDYLSKYPN